MAETEKLVAKQIGRNIILFIKGVKYSKKTVDNTEVKSIVNKLELFNKKPSKARLEEIMEIFSKKTEEEKKLDLEIKGHKKIVKKEAKEPNLEKKKKYDKNKKLIEKVKDFYTKKKIKDDAPTLLVVNKEGDLAMKGCETISMTDLLVSRIEEFVTKQQEIKSLLNFWSLCLLNPNEVARTKLFDYLQNNGLTITPSGYFVTFRMVKTTDNPNEFKPARTGYGGKELIYVPGTVCSIPREECNEDGSRDCSKGLHTGTPKFIGIVANKKHDLEEGKGTVGDGYGYTITTKKDTPQSYGAGYDRPTTESKQKFDNSFGNQAILCLINPAHVVSIPDSDTRKMRSCEFYFAKLTTAEEVIDMVEKDYLLYDGDYNNFELKQLQELLKNKELKAYVNEKTKTGTKVANLEKALNKKKELLKLSSDNINSSLDASALKAIIKRRQIILK